MKLVAAVLALAGCSSAQAATDLRGSFQFSGAYTGTVYLEKQGASDGSGRAMFPGATAASPLSFVFSEDPPADIGTITINIEGHPAIHGLYSFSGDDIIGRDKPFWNLVKVRAPLISGLGGTDGAKSQFSAGEIISIYGSSLGPISPAGTEYDDFGKITTANAKTRVRFSGFPGQILYTQGEQVNVMLPKELSDRIRTQMVLEYDGILSLPITIPLTGAVQFPACAITLPSPATTVP